MGCTAGWWFQTFFMFTLILGKISNLTCAYVSNGLVKNHQSDSGFVEKACYLIINKSLGMLTGDEVAMSRLNPLWHRKDLQRNFCFYGFATVQWSLGPAGQVVKTHAFLWLVFQRFKENAFHAKIMFRYIYIYL